ncbi:MAG: aminotransferase class V-fold PLP-dependent enzyme [Lentisphaeria bacterium]|nr:MAG: aminotransferase class V-fold PLP-dependent enzyme [Lentisphaeria bacterium]
MTVYLDQAAAARPAPEAVEFYIARVREDYANQEAAHQLGREARQRLDQAAEELSLALTGESGWGVIWGGCGTELFNLFADSPLATGKRAVTSPLEHPALLAVLRRAAVELRTLRPRSPRTNFTGTAPRGRPPRPPSGPERTRHHPADRRPGGGVPPALS